MVQVFLAPTGDFAKSVSEGIEISALRSKLSEEESSHLRLIPDGDRVRLWGCHRGTASLWTRMEHEDIVLFVARGTGVFTDCGRVALKSHNRELAEEMGRLGIWPRMGYEYIFFLKDHRSIHISKSQIKNLAKWGGSPPQRFMRVGSQKVSDEIIKMVAFDAFE